MLAIIGGSGLTTLSNLDVTHRRAVRTPYGEPSGALTFGKLHGSEVVFLARHGYGHTIAPHEVNYRANIWALHAEGVDRIVSVASVGGIRADMVPGSLVVPDQIIDYTWGRRSTYFEGVDEPVTHVDFTVPYTEILRQQILGAAQRANEVVIHGGVYAATEGPRLETAAEIRRYERDGADMVGMTGMPEAALARELQLAYATIGVVVNYAAGKGDSIDAIKFEAIEDMLQKTMLRARRVIEQLAIELEPV
jgi:5'-methylthioadenosine phosphorylase